jgi:hypothetical protein
MEAIVGINTAERINKRIELYKSTYRTDVDEFNLHKDIKTLIENAHEVLITKKDYIPMYLSNSILQGISCSGLETEVRHRIVNLLIDEIKFISNTY